MYGKHIINFYEWLENTYIKKYNAKNVNAKIIEYSSAKI